MNSLKNFNNLPVAQAVKALFDELNIPLNSTINEAMKVQDLLDSYYKPNDDAQSLIDEIYFLGMVDDQAFSLQNGLFGGEAWTATRAKNLQTDYEGLVVLAVSLKPRANGLLPTRGQLADISRVFNRAFAFTPVTIVFNYHGHIALANSERISKKDNVGEKIGKVSLLKDIHLAKTHTGHVRILSELAIPRTGSKAVSSFAGLYKHWQSVLSVSTLNKQFYEKLFNWYLWALPQAQFPQIRPAVDMIANEQHQSESLIRLLTRLLFVWFMKEKGLINPQLFDKSDLKTILKNDFLANNGQNTIYYKAILQNLFFATLNKPIHQRKAIDKGFNPKEYGDALIYRFSELFNDEANFLSYFNNIPFLNGGLFDCLDQRKDKNNKESTEIRLDGFSTQKSKQAILPDSLFFGEYNAVDLSSAYDDKKKKSQTVYGLIEILHQYKFTIEENTPQDEEIALDPELLGKVFENLLASYNPETKTTARKQTGSFYTPREIVDYMVDESLIAYLLPHLHDASEDNNRARLQQLLDYSYHYDKLNHVFNDGERTVIILKLNDLTLLDPACGSGAFPMGALNKLVLMLKRLDPDNTLWKRQNKLRLTRDLTRAQQSKNASAIAHASAELQKLELSFSEASQDYPRKLYLIERCIYGVDIQPIATQIAKLRFFISLLVDQSDKPTHANRGFEPLPNLDFKLVTANTLIAAPESHHVDDMFASVQDDFFVQFEQKTHEYFNTHTPQEKEQKKHAIEALIDQKCAQKKQEIEGFFNNANPATQKALKAKYKDVIAQKEGDLRLWESYKNVFKHEAVGFFDIKYFFPQVKEGFDVVIGNPPYLIIPKDDFDTIYSSSYKLQEGKPDLYRIFIEKSLELLKCNGVSSFITPNTFLTIPSAEKIRRFLVQNNTFIKVVNYDESVFESASVNSVVYVLKKSQPNISYNFKVIDLIKNKGLYSDFIYINQLKAMENGKCEINIFSNENSESLIARLKNKSVSLNEIKDVYITLGLQPYHNTIHTQDEIKSRFLHERSKKNENYILELGGKNIKRYYLNKNEDNYLDYSAELYTKPDFTFFNDERVVIREIVSNGLVCSLANDTVLFNKSCYVVKSKNSNFSNKYLLGLLNSKLIGYFVVNTGDKSKQSLFPRVSMRTLKSLPIPNVELQKQQPFITLVDQIMQLKQQGQPTTTQETQIDHMVYALYGLTAQEIAIVEGKTEDRFSN